MNELNQRWTVPTEEELATLQYVDNDEVDNRPVLAENCAWKDFERCEEKFLSYEHGRILVEEYPTYPPYARSVAEISRQLSGYAIGGAPVLTGDDATYHLPGVGARQPDTCFVGWNVPFPGPGGVGAANPQGSAWPTVLVEVCYRRSLATGLLKGPQWLAAGVGVVIVIKIYTRHTDGNIPMVAVQWTAGNAAPVRVISFGSKHIETRTVNLLNALGVTGVGIAGAVPCNAVGLVPYQLPIPTALAMVGTPAALMPPGLPVNWNLDLYRAQERAS